MLKFDLDYGLYLLIVDRENDLLVRIAGDVRSDITEE